MTSLRGNCMVLRSVLLLIPLWLSWSTPAAAAPPRPRPAQTSRLFEQQIRPLLELCIQCHGPETQEAGLRLDTPTGLLRGGDSGPVIQPGNPDASRLIQLVRGTRELTMPPGKPLSQTQIRVLEQWVQTGAAWPASSPRILLRSAGEDHWAFQPISRPPAPALASQQSIRNAVDRFILGRLRREQLTPSPAASRSTQLRRVTLDLVGLPPDRDAMRSFLRDPRPDAYARRVDHLLASPHYGERWGRHWLDGARYADSGGNEGDPFRSMWAYREWVINAFNQDLSFDRFVTDQVAGDLAANATLEQRIATAFYRHTVGPGQLDAVIERVNSTGTVFLGLTVACAQCHSHKFDPVSQREYYQLLAFFNQSDDPVLSLDGRVTRQARLRFRRQVRQLENQLKQRQQELSRTLADWSAALTADQLAALPIDVREILSIPPAQRTAEQGKKLVEAYGQTYPDYGILKRSLAAHQQHETSLDTILVLNERTTRRTTHVLLRGNPQSPGPEVTPDVPRIFPALPEAKPRTRRDLAAWLVSAEQPLTPRVAVNRVWQQLFGTGLVATENDFGVQGERPSHPALLDWLASDFRDHGWQVKRLHRMLVTSATYRQSSHVRSELLAIDPQNRLLARQRRLRLSAEAIRDQALAVSGLLSRELGGPSVFPSQAAGVMQGRADKSTWITDADASVYRRGLYIHFWRLTPHPFLKVFDGPDASEACTRRHRSNTPMQALALLNHEWFLQCAQELAARILRESDSASRIRFAFEVCLGRTPSSTEEQIVEELLAAELSAPVAKATSESTSTSVAEESEVDVLTAWSSVARTLLNLDEFITRE
ncbi:MAG: PSD1 and planctomycete cytochrome C domain-containing protein [Planctomycetota bacterium]|nr:PSD1 and planctomycete cytochrome C domain-containing protein [Planctomycetota bacterium]